MKTRLEVRLAWALTLVIISTIAYTLWMVLR